MQRNEPFKVILIHGPKQSGKSTIAYRLVSDHSFDTISFATSLKDMCKHILKTLDCIITDEHFEDGDLKESIVINNDGEQFMFNRGGMLLAMTYRQVLQYVGTELFRNQFHTDIWAGSVCGAIRDSINNPYRRGIVIPDMRFPNECDFVENFLKQFGKMAELTTVAVQRPGYGGNDAHASETSMKGHTFDVVINNDGDLKDLIVKSDKLATGMWRHDMFAAKQSEIQTSSFLNKYS